MAAIGFLAVGVPLILIGVAIICFFRDPERRSDAPANAVLSAADGRVCDISAAILPDDASEASYTRISVFMSPLDVHVNRASISGEVIAVKHSKGEFRAAFRDAASEHNERNLVKIKDSAAHHHAIVQVAGYLARRIVCRLHPDQQLHRGERIGLIMFGSRVDHFLPPECRIAVALGDRVRAGETVIGELPL